MRVASMCRPSPSRWARIRFDLIGQERAHSAAAGLARFADQLRRIGLDMTPFDGPLQHALDDDQRLAGRCVADAGRAHLGPEAPEHLGIEGAKGDVADPGKTWTSSIEA